MWKSSNSFNGYWWWEFINGEKVPFIIYADLESLLEKKSNHQQLKQINIQLLKKNLVFSRDKDEKDL